MYFIAACAIYPGGKRPLFFRTSGISRTCYDANSNRLTAINKTTSDTDLDGGFDG